MLRHYPKSFGSGRGGVPRRGWFGIARERYSARIKKTNGTASSISNHLLQPALTWLERHPSLDRQQTQMGAHSEDTLADHTATCGYSDREMNSVYWLFSLWRRAS